MLQNVSFPQLHPSDDYVNLSNDVTTIRGMTASSAYTSLPLASLPGYRATATVALAGLVVAGTCFNAATVVASVKDRLNGSQTNVLIFSLACSDLLTSIVPCTLLLTAFVSARWPLGRIGCELYLSLVILFGTASINTVSAIAVERYKSVTVQPFNNYTTKRYAVKALVIVWSLAIFWSAVPIVSSSWVGIDEGTLACAVNWRLRDATHVAYPLCYVTLGMFAPFAVKVIIYCRVYRRVSAVSRNLQNGTQSFVVNLAVRLSHTSSRWSLTSRQSSSSTRSSIASSISNHLLCQNPRTRLRHQRCLAVAMIVMALSSVCAWLPNGVLPLVMMALHDSNLPTQWLILTSLMANASVVSNPIIYVLLNKKLRLRLLRAMLCHRHDRMVGYSPTPPIVLPGDTTQTAPRSCHPIPTKPADGKLAARFSQPVLSTINELCSQMAGTTGSYNRPVEICLNMSAAPSLVSRSESELTAAAAEMDRSHSLDDCPGLYLDGMSKSKEEMRTTSITEEAKRVPRMDAMLHGCQISCYNQMPSVE